MTQLYFGLNRGADQDPDKIVFTSGASGGTDVEVRVDDSKGLTRGDIFLILEAFDRYFCDTSRTTINNI